MESVRPQWIDYGIWAIPVITCICLALILSNPAKMTPLVESDDTAYLQEVEDLLQEQGVVYQKTSDRIILVDSSQLEEMSDQLERKEIARRQITENTRTLQR